MIPSLLRNATRDQLLHRIAEVCYNDQFEDPLPPHTKWQDMTTEQLRTVVSLVDEELFTLFHRSKERRRCSLLETLYDYIKIRGIAFNPMNDNRPFTRHERSTIFTAMKAFFPDRMDEIEKAEHFFHGFPEFEIIRNRLNALNVEKIELSSKLKKIKTDVIFRLAILSMEHWTFEAQVFEAERPLKTLLKEIDKALHPIDAASASGRHKLVIHNKDLVEKARNMIESNTIPANTLRILKEMS